MFVDNGQNVFGTCRKPWRIERFNLADVPVASSEVLDAQFEVEAAQARLAVQGVVNAAFARRNAPILRRVTEDRATSGSDYWDALLARQEVLSYDSSHPTQDTKTESPTVSAEL